MTDIVMLHLPNNKEVIYYANGQVTTCLPYHRLPPAAAAAGGWASALLVLTV